MSEDGSAPRGDMPAPVVGAGAGQEVVDIQELVPPPVAPLREDHVQNAVAFLNHPKVHGSSEDAKRSFLERKGLTAAEMAEAFRRVPSDLPGSASASAVAPAPYAAGATVDRPAAAAPVYVAGPLAAPQQVAAPQSIRWTQVALGLTILGAGAYALKQLLLPHILAAYDRWTASVAAKARKMTSDDAAAADKLAVAIQAQTEEMRATVAGMKETVAALHVDDLRSTLIELKNSIQGRKDSEEGAISKADLRRELRSFATTLSEYNGVSGQGDDTSEWKEEVREMKQLLSQAVRSGALGSPARSGTESVAMHTPWSSPNAGPAQQQHGSPAPVPYYGNGRVEPAANDVGLPPVHRTEPVANGRQMESGAAAAEEVQGPPPNPASYKDILQMLEQGKTPPGIRNDINDKPPDPSQAPSDARLQPRPKPWERAASGAGSLSVSGGGGLPFGSGGGGAGPSAAQSSAPSPTPVSEAGSSGAWKPPPVPQPSLRSARSTKSSAAGSTASSVNEDA